jgi:AraC family transcriptional regulator
MSITMARGEFFGRSVAAGNWGELSLSETRYARGAFLPWHRHEDAYLTFVLAGGYRERVQHETRTCGARSLVVHPAGDTHEDDFAERPSRCLNVVLGASFARRFGDALARGVVVEDVAVSSFGARVAAELRCGDDAAPMIVEGLLLELFGMLSRRTGAERRMPAWLVEARSLVEQRWRSKWSLAELADDVGVHPVHLARSFRAHFGVTVGEHVRALRIAHARERIAAGDALSVVATDAGFADQSHFTRAFVRAAGLTPAEYRRRAKPGPRR